MGKQVYALWLKGRRSVLECVPTPERGNESLSFVREIGDRAGMCRTLFNTGHIHWQNSGFGYDVGQPTPSFEAELALDPESRRQSKLSDENRPKLKPSPRSK